MSIVYVNGAAPAHTYDSRTYKHNSKDDDETDSALGSSHSNSTHSPETPGSSEERFEDYGAAEEAEPELLNPFGEKKSLSAVPSFNRTASVRRSVRQRPSPASVRRTPSFGLNGSASKNSPGSHRHAVEDGDPDADDDWNSLDSFQREDDVYHFSQQMEKLQNQVATLVQSQANQEDNASKLRQDNAGLIERCSLLEEQIREQEVKYEERLREEHRKNMDLLQRLERDKLNELENRNTRISTLEAEVNTLRNASFALQTQTEKYRLEKLMYSDKLTEAERQMSETTEEARRVKEALRREREDASNKDALHEQEIADLRTELDSLRVYKIENEKYSSSFNTKTAERVRDVELELQRLKQENTRLEESNQELNLQVMNSHIAQGQSLLKSEMGSLFAEFSDAGSSKAEILDALTEQQEVNRKLKAYLDQMLVDVLERAPQLLEVKRK